MFSLSWASLSSLNKLSENMNTSTKVQTHVLCAVHDPESLWQQVETILSLPPLLPHKHSNMMEAVLSAAPWLINQMDCRPDEGVGGGKQRWETSCSMQLHWSLTSSPYECHFTHTWLTPLPITGGAINHLEVCLWLS